MLLEEFDVRDKKDRFISGRGEIRELDQLLGDMPQPKKDFYRRKDDWSGGNEEGISR